MSSIEEAFKARIVALSTAAGSRVYREVVEQEPDAMPVISFTRTGAPPMPRLLDTGVPCLNRALFRVEVIADSAASAEDVASALQDGLDGWRGVSSGVDVLRCAMTYQGDAAYIDGDKYLRITQQDYEVTFR